MKPMRARKRVREADDALPEPKATKKPAGRAAAPPAASVKAIPVKAPPAIAPIEKRLKQKIARGSHSIDARLDLHGHSQSEAHDALYRFLRRAQSRGGRLVLVITGKGKDRDDGTVLRAPRGVLRHQVPSWVQTGMLAAIVLQITPAHISHGGEGAYYVYLRRRR